MSTMTRKGKSRYARMISLNEPLRRPGQKLAPLGPSPACLGGSHRRCLLDESTCSCPHHLTDFVDARPPVVRDVYPCPICDEQSPSAEARVAHMASAHPPKMTNTSWPCFYCNRRFESVALRAEHTLDAHSLPKPLPVYRCFEGPCRGIDFRSEPKLRRHRRICHPEAAS